MSRIVTVRLVRPAPDDLPPIPADYPIGSVLSVDFDRVQSYKGHAYVQFAEPFYVTGKPGNRVSVYRNVPIECVEVVG